MQGLGSHDVRQDRPRFRVSATRSARRQIGTLVWLLLALGGCGSNAQRPARAPSPGPAVANSPTTPTHSPTQSAIRLSPEIRQACGISDADAHFDFDSARIRDRDYPILKKLVDCFTTGPLAHKQMRLVGHTDPRGNDAYNLVLGESRAYGVKQFLVDQGLSQQQATTTSRGELEARGTNEASWAADRRVDILLAN
jgi:peptidoglycan-associated lipoprotein